MESLTAGEEGGGDWWMTIRDLPCFVLCKCILMISRIFVSSPQHLCMWVVVVGWNMNLSIELLLFYSKNNNQQLKICCGKRISRV